MQPPTVPLLTAFLPVVCRLARRAGAVVMSVYYSDFTVVTKLDESPVTVADQAAEQLIVDELYRLASDIPVIAEEETTAASRPPSIRTDLFWLVDALDGTKDFIRRNGEFTINIALIKNHRPVLGVIYVPVSDHLYAATTPGTAVVERDGGAYPLHVRRPPARGAVVVASRQHDDTLLEAFLHNRKVQSVTRASSSLKFCLIAAGLADFYPRFGRTMEWDTAAGHAILNAAGGSVCTTEGEELCYGKPGFDNPYFIACGAVPF